MRTARMSAIILAPDGLRIPGALPDLAAFRRWTQSPEFPEKGRIDWIAGELEVDMAPEELNTHGTPKVAIASGLQRLIVDADLGVVLVDSMRITSPQADLSVEPDVVVILFDSVDCGRVKLVRRPGSRKERCTEIQGAPDLVVECVSDSSVAKDRVRLRERYAAAGIPEYWIADARPDVPLLTILRRVNRGYREMRHDREGYVRSPLLDAWVRLTPLPVRSGLVRYKLTVRGR